MRLIMAVFFILILGPIQVAVAKADLGKYQKLSVQLEKLCESHATVEDFVSTIRKAGGFRAIKGTRYVGKAGAVNLGRVRLKILENGEWDLVTEVPSPSKNLLFKTEHFAPSVDYQLFAFVDAKPLAASSITKQDKPTLVIFTPSKVIAVCTDSDKNYYLLDRPDHNFAEISHRLKSRLGI